MVLRTEAAVVVLLYSTELEPEEDDRTSTAC